MAVARGRLPAANTFIVGGVPVVAIRRGRDRVVFTPRRCAHRGGPLNLGAAATDGRTVTCPWHERGTRCATAGSGALSRVAIARRGAHITMVGAVAPEITWSPVVRPWGAAEVADVWEAP